MLKVRIGKIDLVCFVKSVYWKGECFISSRKNEWHWHPVLLIFGLWLYNLFLGVTFYFSVILHPRIFFYWFSEVVEGQEERRGEREGLALDWESNLWPFSAWSNALTTGQHQAGLQWTILSSSLGVLRLLWGTTYTSKSLTTCFPY